MLAVTKCVQHILDKVYAAQYPYLSAQFPSVISHGIISPSVPMTRQVSSGYPISTAFIAV